jgi:hypothetical protein
MYYLFRQNNSRGMFKAPAVNVFVEADSAAQATELFLTIKGCYFDPRCDFDCPCCGSRWSGSYEYFMREDMYVRISEEKERATRWMNEGIPTAYILHSNQEPETL